MRPRDTRRRRALFQSTPPRGGRLGDGVDIAAGTVGFNPRPRAGGDHGLVIVVVLDVSVSIHAPARGATGSRRRPATGRPLCFNPRPRAGGDGIYGRETGAAVGFQSTPPRGGRPDEREEEL